MLQFNDSALYATSLICDGRVTEKKAFSTSSKTFIQSRRTEAILGIAPFALLVHFKALNNLREVYMK